MGQSDHGWRGRGRVRAARLGDALVLRFAEIGTRAGRIRSDVAAFFRKEYPTQRPSPLPFEVRIWAIGLSGRIDVDNVAKACLDALTGPVWRDDSQVRRLTVEKLPAGGRFAPGTVVVTARRLETELCGADLDRLLDAVDRIADPRATPAARP